MSSRHPAGGLASPAGPTPGAVCGLAALKSSGGDGARGGRFSGDSAALAEGILKSHRQEEKQHSKNHKDKVLTREW